MDTYPRRFVLASLIYLLIGVLVGFLNAFYVVPPVLPDDMKFMHVHYNLLGFMTMMVAGVGYHILPRFNGTSIYFPRWVAPHFWMANVGLILTVIGFHFHFRHGWARVPFEWGKLMLIVGATLSTLSIVMFVINLFLTIRSGGVAKNVTPTPKEVPEKPVEQPAKVNWKRVDPSIKVAELVDQYPGTLDILVNEGGLTPLAMPGHIDRVREIGIVLGTAIMNHNGDLEYVLSKLEEHINSVSAVNSVSQSSKPQPVTTKPVVSGDITKDMVIGDVLAMYPGTRGGFMNFFGEGCFSCPGQATETIDQAAKMHGVNPDTLIEKLNQSKDS